MATMSERLREAVLSYEYGGAIHPKNVTAAADLMDEMAKALEPLAKAIGDEAFDPYDAARDEDQPIFYTPESREITLGHLRSARAILSRFREAG